MKIEYKKRKKLCHNFYLKQEKQKKKKIKQATVNINKNNNKRKTAAVNVAQKFLFHKYEYKQYRRHHKEAYYLPLNRSVRQ